MNYPEFNGIHIEMEWKEKKSYFHLSESDSIYIIHLQRSLLGIPTVINKIIVITNLISFRSAWTYLRDK